MTVGSGWTTAVSIFAALGIGSIAAALIARWNSVSQLRQAWVDSLRSEIADFFHSVDQVGAALGDRTAGERIRERRDQALLAYRRVLLRLNLAERDHRLLARRLKALVRSVGSTAGADDVDVAMASAKRVLKAEWERTKFGPFVRLAGRLKRMGRLRRLKRERRTTR